MNATRSIAAASVCVAVSALLAAGRPQLHPSILSGVRADAANPAAQLGEINAAFEAFKAANETRIAALEKNKTDPLATEEGQKIQAAIDDMTKKFAALELGGPGGDNVVSADQRAYDTAFNAFFREGGRESELKALAVKAQVNRQSDPAGGYLVSSEIESEIDRVLGTVSVMRQLATVRSIGKATYKKRTGLGGAKSGWVGENEVRTKTDTPQLSELEFPAMTIYAEPEATTEMLEDADLDIAAWLAGEVDIEFGEQEGVAYINGNGVKRPRGLLAYDTVEEDAWAWGKIGYRVSGDANTFGTNADKLIQLTEDLKQGYRQGASWLMNRGTARVVRTLKDGDGNYIWERDLKSGRPNQLLGYSVETDDNMPGIAAGALPVAFGDFKRGYLIVDRRGVQVLRNPFKNSGYVTFYTTKRVGGGVQNFQAVKFLKISA